MKQSIQFYINAHKTVHLIGIGGVSMNSLAELLLSLGAAVTGSDRNASPVTTRLEQLGATIHYAHSPENVEQADLIVRTAAVHDDNPEVIRARELHIPIMERAEAWGELMAKYEQVVCLSGTHGKTTTTSMMTLITMQAGLDPTVMVGSRLSAIDGTLRIGAKDCFVAESCEYCNSFLHFRPTIAVVLNVEADHLDFFHDIEDIIHSFHKFCLLTPPDGAIVVNADDPNAMRAAADLPRTVLTFGMAPSAYARAENITEHHGYYTFDAMIEGKHYAHITLSVPGKHNLLNALACCAVCAFMKLPGTQVANGLAAFTGSERRFQRTCALPCGAVVVDDYAHHPSEMRATLTTAQEMNFRRIICAFQPHTYTRTKALFSEFVSALSLCDKVVLAPIYAAREQNTVGISSQALAKELDNAVCFDTYEEIAAHLQSIAQDGDLILTMGAGPIDTVGKLLAESGKSFKNA